MTAISVKFLILALLALPVACGGAGERYGANVVQSPFGAYLAAAHASRQRDYDAASRFYEAAAERDPENALLIERAFFQSLAADRMDVAFDLARRLDALDDHRMARIALAVEALGEGRLTDARGLLAGGGFGAANAALADILESWALAGEGRAEEAIEILSRSRPGLFNGFHAFHRALIRDYSGDQEGARADFQDAIRGPAGVAAQRAYGIFLERTDPEEAKNFYRQILETAPGNALAAAGLDRIESSRTPAPAARTPQQGAALAFLNLGGALAGERALEAPLIYLNFATYLDDSLDHAHVLKGELFEREELWEQAIAAFERVSPASPFYGALRLTIARALDSLGRSDEAITLLSDHISNSDDDDPRAAIYLADLLRINERWEEAAAQYTAVLEDPRYADRVADYRIHFSRGIALERAGRWEEAEQDMLTALEQTPDDPFVLNYLGYTWVDRGENIERAFDMIRRALELEPHSGAITDSLGWAHYRRGDFDSAVRYLERAVELEVADPVIIDHLGDAYWRVGRKREAGFQWKRALELDPEPDLRARIEEKLESGLDVPLTTR